MEFPIKTIATAEAETAKLAIQFAKIIKPGDVISLVGDLGTGKTFFVKNVASEFECIDVNSPTFAIVNVYSGTLKVNHFDFYRIKKIEELYDLGFEDYIMDRDSITFIEWSDMYHDILPTSRYEVRIKFLSESKREFNIIKFGK
ncbi:MAG: tRNA (adenosine(37)-N6)-threonylcarbamoyltransferase complex ATPase subunit type 1 TsaE [Bacteroidota bacterium]